MLQAAEHLCDTQKEPVVEEISTKLYRKVKFGNFGFSIGKRENSGFFKNYCSSDLKVSVSRHLRYVNIKGQGHFLTLAQGCVHKKFQTGIFQKLLCRSEPNFV